VNENKIQAPIHLTISWIGATIANIDVEKVLSYAAAILTIILTSWQLIIMIKKAISGKEGSSE
jgi:hypothetical protein